MRRDRFPQRLRLVVGVAPGGDGTPPPSGADLTPFQGALGMAKSVLEDAQADLPPRDYRVLLSVLRIQIEYELRRLGGPL